MATLQEAQQSVLTARQQVESERKRIEEAKKQVESIYTGPRDIAFQKKYIESGIIPKGRVEQTAIERRQLKKRGRQTIQQAENQVREFEQRIEESESQIEQYQQQEKNRTQVNKALAQYRLQQQNPESTQYNPLRYLKTSEQKRLYKLAVQSGKKQVAERPLDGEVFINGQGFSVAPDLQDSFIKKQVSLIKPTQLDASPIQQNLQMSITDEKGLPLVLEKAKSEIEPYDISFSGGVKSTVKNYIDLGKTAYALTMPEYFQSKKQAKESKEIKEGLVLGGTLLVTGTNKAFKEDKSLLNKDTYKKGLSDIWGGVVKTGADIRNRPLYYGGIVATESALFAGSGLAYKGVKNLPKVFGFPKYEAEFISFPKLAGEASEDILRTRSVAKVKRKGILTEAETNLDLYTVTKFDDTSKTFASTTQGTGRDVLFNIRNLKPKASDNLISFTTKDTGTVVDEIADLKVGEVLDTKDMLNNPQIASATVKVPYQKIESFSKEADVSLTRSPVYSPRKEKIRFWTNQYKTLATKRIKKIGKRLKNNLQIGLTKSKNKLKDIKYNTLLFGYKTAKKIKKPFNVIENKKIQIENELFSKTNPRRYRAQARKDYFNRNFTLIKNIKQGFNRSKAGKATQKLIDIKDRFAFKKQINEGTRYSGYAFNTGNVDSIIDFGVPFKTYKTNKGRTIIKYSKSGRSTAFGVYVKKRIDPVYDFGNALPKEEVIDVSETGLTQVAKKKTVQSSPLENYNKNSALRGAIEVVKATDKLKTNIKAKRISKATSSLGTLSRISSSAYAGKGTYELTQATAYPAVSVKVGRQTQQDYNLLNSVNAVNTNYNNKSSVLLNQNSGLNQRQSNSLISALTQSQASSQVQLNRLQLGQAQTQLQIQTPVFKTPSRQLRSPRIKITNRTGRSFIPLPKFRNGKPSLLKRNKRRNVRRTDYSPSFTALGLNIRSRRKPSLIAGTDSYFAGIRPIVN